jgi:hypothetical protein
MFRAIFGILIVSSFSVIACAQTCVPEPAHLPASMQVFSPAGGTWNNQWQLTPYSPLSCTWKITVDVPWITFLSATSGFTGPSYMFFLATVAPNTGNVPLHATVTFSEGDVIVGRFPIVVLSNSCSYNVDPPSAQIPQQGGSGQFSLGATPSDCFPFDPNATNYGTVLTGSTSVRYDHGIFYWGLPPNAGTALSATATLSTQPIATFSVTQDGSAGSMQVGCPIANVQRVGAQFPILCTVVGGKQPYKWAITDGSLPAGLSQIRALIQAPRTGLRELRWPRDRIVSSKP